MAVSSGRASLRLKSALESAEDADDSTASGPVSFRSSMVSTTGTDGDATHKLSFNGDVIFPEIQEDDERRQPCDSVFPTSRPELKRKLYSNLALQPCSGDSRPTAFNPLLQVDVDRVRANLSEMEDVLSVLDDKLEPVSLRELGRPPRELKMMAGPGASTLLQRRTTHFSE